MKHYLPAILTAIFWGVSYASGEYSLKTIDKKFFFLITGITTAVFWSSYFFVSKSPTDTYNTDPKGLCWLIFSIFCGLLGNFFCIKAIQQMGSVKASVIEITYPIFCALFIMLCNRSFSLNLIQVFCMVVVLLGSAGFMWYDQK
jgi:drug/metabolite transporter (DMT)-like permease